MHHNEVVHSIFDKISIIELIVTRLSLVAIVVLEEGLTKNNTKETLHQSPSGPSFWCSKEFHPLFFSNSNSQSHIAHTLQLTLM